MKPIPDTAQIVPWQASPEQQRVLANIWRRAWTWAQGHRVEHIEPLPHWQARVQAEFTEPAEVLVAAHAGQPLGFLVMLPSTAYVAQLHIDPDHHRKGLGSRLLDAAKRRFPDGWHLHVALVNESAQGFYRHYGLERGTLDRHPHSGRERVAFHWHPHPIRPSTA